MRPSTALGLRRSWPERRRLPLSGRHLLAVGVVAAHVVARLARERCRQERVGMRVGPLAARAGTRQRQPAGQITGASQFADEVDPWLERWGPVAIPLLWCARCSSPPRPAVVELVPATLPPDNPERRRSRWSGRRSLANACWRRSAAAHRAPLSEVEQERRDRVYPDPLRLRGRAEHDVAVRRRVFEHLLDIAGVEAYLLAAAAAARRGVADVDRVGPVRPQQTVVERLLEGPFTRRARSGAAQRSCLRWSRPVVGRVPASKRSRSGSRSPTSSP